MPFIDHLKSRVKPIQKRIVLPENNSDRALKAAAIVALVKDLPRSSLLGILNS